MEAILSETNLQLGGIAQEVDTAQEKITKVGGPEKITKVTKFWNYFLNFTWSVTEFYVTCNGILHVMYVFLRDILLPFIVHVWTGADDGAAGQPLRGYHHPHTEHGHQAQGDQVHR